MFYKKIIKPTTVKNYTKDKFISRIEISWSDGTVSQHEILSRIQPNNAIRINSLWYDTIVKDTNTDDFTPIKMVDTVLPLERVQNIIFNKSMLVDENGNHIVGMHIKSFKETDKRIHNEPHRYTHQEYYFGCKFKTYGLLDIIE